MQTKLFANDGDQEESSDDQSLSNFAFHQKTIDHTIFEETMSDNAPRGKVGFIEEIDSDSEDLRGVRFAPSVSYGYGGDAFFDSQELDEIEYVKKLSLGFQPVPNNIGTERAIHDYGDRLLSPSAYLASEDIEEQRALYQSVSRSLGKTEPPPILKKGTHFCDEKNTSFNDVKMPAKKSPPRSNHYAQSPGTNPHMDEEEMFEAIERSRKDSSHDSARPSSSVQAKSTVSIPNTHQPWTIISAGKRNNWFDFGFKNVNRSDPPDNDRGGQMIAQGTKSQYTWEGGQVACTSICLVATKDLLAMDPVEWLRIDAKTLDHWLEKGISRHQSHGKTHSSVEQLWMLQLFSDISELHEMACPLQGNISKQLGSTLQKALDFAIKEKDGQPLAVVFTKSGETVVCVTAPGFSNDWILLDSHGESHQTRKIIYMKKFSSMYSIASFLMKKYPAQSFGDGSFQAEMYNMFEAFPIVRRDTDKWDEDLAPLSLRENLLLPAKSCSDTDSKAPALTNEKNVSSDSEKDIVVEPKTNHAPSRECPTISCGNDIAVEPEPSKIPAVVQKCPPVSFTQPGQKTDLNSHPANNVPSDKTVSEQDRVASEVSVPLDQPSISQNIWQFIDKADYEDPITYQVMADPVTCQDGHTYDRQVIERCFTERIRAEEQRLKEISGEAVQTEESCCGSRREPIALISPISGKVVSEELVPNHVIEQQIVRFMEKNAFSLSDDDMADWRKRREAKKLTDLQRAEDERKERLRLEEMRKNAEEAERRNRDNVENGSGKGTEFASQTQDKSRLVRLDRNVNDAAERLSDADIGLSCAVNTDHSLRVPKQIARTEGSVLRCMVHRCATRLSDESFTWCGRCARIVCKDCLGFDVSNIQAPSEVHKICVDCVSQLVDNMESGNIHLRQKRVILTQSLESLHTARFANRATNLQEQAVRHKIFLRNAPHKSRIEDAVSFLEEDLSSLKREVRLAAERASAAREEKGDGEGADHEILVAKLMMDCDNLERQFTEAESKQTPEDEEEAMKYFESLSELSFRLESARVELATALSESPVVSSATGKQGVSSSGEQPSSRFPRKSPREKIIALEREYAELNSRYCTLLEQPATDEEEAAFARAVEISALQTSLEEIQTRIVITQSQDEARTAASNSFPKNVKEAIDDIEAIGWKYENWPLPFGLEYPTSRMEQQLEILKNTLELRRVETERAVELEWEKELADLDARQDALESEISLAKETLHDAKRDAEEEEERARVRAEERRQRELERLERERVLREQAEKAERERQELLARHRREEEATRAAFASAAGANNQGATTFGGVGDLRMCGRCKAGPVENKACTDLSSHNNSSTTYKGDSVRSKTNPNHCPHCGWFDANWHNWPYWDGVHGPH